MLVTWLLLAVVFIGWGRLFQRLIRILPAEDAPEQLLPSFWLGLCLLLAFLQAWHIFAPVAAASLAVEFAVAAAGWAVSGLGPLKALATAARRNPAQAAGALLIALFLCHQACGSPYLQDLGGYHLQCIRWDQAYPIVPGLGCLNPRLAFESSIFLLDAQILDGPWREAGFGLVNGLLLAGVAAQAGASLRNLILDRYDFSECVAAALAIPVLGYQGLMTETTS